ncbi:MAG: lipocalin family protein [Bacteroidetes bacterium]|nr:lipocalin family protein [Bacteroidota bacterium]
MLKKILCFVTLISIFSCSKNSDNIPAENLQGKWYLSHIFTYRQEEGKSPLQATMNGWPEDNIIIFNEDGTCKFQKLYIDTYGFNIFGNENYSGTYQLSGNNVALQLNENGEKIFLDLTVKKISATEMELNQEKTQILSGLEKSKTAWGQETYNDAMAFANQYKTYKISNTFIKMQ